jgi:hypothetical protein
MRNNVLFRVGVLIIIASALIWLGAELTRRIEWILPYTVGAGGLFAVLGLFNEARRRKAATLAVAAMNGESGADLRPTV